MTPTSGMAKQQARLEDKLLSIRGDLLAIGLLLDAARDVPFAERKHLWNAQSRLRTRIVTDLGILDITGESALLAREVIGWAVEGIR